MHAPSITSAIKLKNNIGLNLMEALLLLMINVVILVHFISILYLHNKHVQYSQIWVQPNDSVVNITETIVKLKELNTNITASYIKGEQSLEILKKELAPFSSELIDINTDYLPEFIKIDASKLNHDQIMVFLTQLSTLYPTQLKVDFKEYLLVLEKVKSIEKGVLFTLLLALLSYYFISNLSQLTRYKLTYSNEFALLHNNGASFYMVLKILLKPFLLKQLIAYCSVTFVLIMALLNLALMKQSSVYDYQLILVWQNIINEISVHKLVVCNVLLALLMIGALSLSSYKWWMKGSL